MMIDSKKTTAPSSRRPANRVGRIHASADMAQAGTSTHECVLRCSSFFVSLLFATGAAAATPPSPLALSCTGCHQPAVNSPEMPSLSLMTPAAIEASLKSTRDKPQSGSIMARFTAKMSDAEIAQLAAELGARTTGATKP